MRRPLFIAFLVSFVATECLAADKTTAFRPSQRKGAIEKMLNSPLNWKPGDREHVTLAELIDYVREEHHLQVRWDTGSLGMVFGDQAPLRELFDRPTYGLAAYPNEVAAPHLWASQHNSKPGQAQTLEPSLGPSKPAVAATPAVPSPGYGLPSLAPAPRTVPDNKPTAVAAQGAPASYPPAPSNRASQQAATQPANYPRAVSGPNTPVTDQPVTGKPTVDGPETVIAKYLTTPIALTAVSLERATVEEGLRQLLEAVSDHTVAVPFQVGLPITTRALALDLLVDENSVLITTQLRANAKKETRVYRLNALSEIPPESLERVITHSIRPWSWRNQATEIAEQWASRWPKSPLPIPSIKLDAIEGIKFESAEEGSGAGSAASAMPRVTEDTIAATGQLVAGGAVAAAHSIVAALEIMHHGDPPTGVIESLPGILIITQSQAAHREIKELLDELGEEQ